MSMSRGLSRSRRSSSCPARSLTTCIPTAQGPLRAAHQHWVGPLLAKGVTITMGTVCEPYLSGTPDLAAFTARLVYLGFTFGEAAYAAQSVLSWQTTVNGRPALPARLAWIPTAGTGIWRRAAAS